MRPIRDGSHVPDNILKWIFLNAILWISMKISLKFVPRVRINNIQPLAQLMALRRVGKPLSEPMMGSLLTHIYVPRSQWTKCLSPLRKRRGCTCAMCGEKLGISQSSISMWTKLYLLKTCTVFRVCTQNRHSPISRLHGSAQVSSGSTQLHCCKQSPMLLGPVAVWLCSVELTWWLRDEKSNVQYYVRHKGAYYKDFGDMNWHSVVRTLYGNRLYVSIDITEDLSYFGLYWDKLNLDDQVWRTLGDIKRMEWRTR